MRDADRVVFGLGAVSRPAEQLRAELDEIRTRGQQVLSERSFLRSLELIPPLPEEARPYSAADLRARGELHGDQLDQLILFDVVEGEDGRFGFRALTAIRQAARLLKDAPLADLAFATAELREMFSVAEPLAQLQLAADHDGKIALRTGERLSDLNGQFRLAVTSAGPDAAELLGQAEAARADGDHAAAELYLRRALAGSPKDLDVLFELGSLLCETDRFAEGLAFLQKATALRPSFADAWYNIAHALERRDRRGAAREAYERAIKADPTYPDPLFNLGMIDLDDGRFASAIERFEAYLHLDPGSEWAAKARKALALARLSLVKAAG